MARNEKLWAIIEGWPLPQSAREQIYSQIVRYEDEALDYIRMQAAQHGLFPAIVGKVLMETGLGTWLSPEEMTQLSTQEAAQQADLAEMVRRLSGGEGL